MKSLLGAGIAGVIVAGSIFAGYAFAAEDADKIMQKLQEIQILVGRWDGSGKSPTSEGWDETIDCGWKFNTKKGTMSLHWALTSPDEKKGKGRILDEGLFTYDVSKDMYVFRAYIVGSDDPLVFEGGPKSTTNFLFERVNKGDAKDKLDQFDIKFLNDGDRLVYSFKQRKGRKSFSDYATAAVNRSGTSFAGGASQGPLCIVTGGLGSIQVEYNGSSYPVCCTGCKAMFLDSPQKYIDKAKK